jgi:D-serine deaminase-like pyridoxal phosphate-dependent protein
MHAASRTLHELGTPALVLDAARLRRNAARMRARCEALGVRLRPHVKTVKSVPAIREALGAVRGPITVSTLAEAEHFAAAGFDDIVHAVCATPDRLARAAARPLSGVRFGLICDDVHVARALGEVAGRLVSRLGSRSASQSASKPGGRFDAYVELDVGEHRTGVDVEAAATIEIARALQAAPALTLRGVLTHAGHSYACRSREAIAAVAEDERRLAARAATRLREDGLPCEVVSAGSTPTATQLVSAEGLTELRPGVYLLMDVFQASIGVCAQHDIAASVLATVIARHDSGRRLVLDSGALALSKDRGVSSDGAPSYGLVAELRGVPLDGARVTDLHQEHGEVRAASPLPVRVGERVRVLPNHACLTAAAYDRFHVVEGEDERIHDEWPRLRGW